ncbi:MULTISPECIES: hypothetical protein [unclassified Streptomyces]|uniref:hypothetical protein n=1 Tax=unclassified Streptomyces TaxID=2593676 RepID=UPI00068C8567|nr:MULTISPECIES: hypothetical protein [unclassified Streptomyces]
MYAAVPTVATEAAPVRPLTSVARTYCRLSYSSPPRKHIERLDADGEAVDIELGTFLDNTRRRADELTPERHAELDRIGLDW